MAKRLISYFAAIILLGGGAAAAGAQGAPAAQGQLLFKQRCSVCHAVAAGQPAGAGPNLAGVIGRRAASTTYPYSSALKASGLTWDKATVDRFLAGPGKLVPGTRMPIAVPVPTDRAAIVAYLATLK